MDATYVFVFTIYNLTMPRGYSKERTSVHRLHYHFTWCPKYRKSVLTGEANDRLGALIEEKADELTYERRQRFFGELDGSVWDAPRVHDRYKGVLGSATAKELKWDDHRWSALSRAHRPNEEHTDQSILRPA